MYKYLSSNLYYSYYNTNNSTSLIEAASPSHWYFNLEPSLDFPNEIKSPFLPCYFPTNLEQKTSIFLVNEAQISILLIVLNVEDALSNRRTWRILWALWLFGTICTVHPNQSNQRDPKRWMLQMSYSHQKLTLALPSNPFLNDRSTTCIFS